MTPFSCKTEIKLWLISFSFAALVITATPMLVLLKMLHIHLPDGVVNAAVCEQICSQRLLLNLPINFRHNQLGMAA